LAGRRKVRPRYTEPPLWGLSRLAVSAEERSLTVVSSPESPTPVHGAAAMGSDPAATGAAVAGSVPVV
jgi:hypothetical protein